MIFVQARLRSSRFPNKVLAEIGGSPIISRVVRACLSNSVGHSVVVLLPKDELGSQLHATLGNEFQNSVQLHFGDHENVYSRFRTAYLELKDEIEAEPPQLGLVRVCADRPFLQPSLIDALDHVRFGEDLLYNHIPEPGFPGPRGLGAESLSRSLAMNFFGESETLPISSEHVTENLYLSNLVSTRFVFPALLNPAALPQRFDVDSPEDLTRSGDRQVALQAAWGSSYVQ